MSKTTRPNRRPRNDRSREPKEYEEATLSVDRVTRVVAGGRRMRFRAVVVIGNKRGKVGLGTGKANEVQAAVQKAAQDAKRNMIRIPLKDGTIPHQVDVKFKAARIRLMPAFAGTGIIAGGALRTVLDHAGVKDVLSKRYGTNNKLVNAQCVMKALTHLRGQPVQDVLPTIAAVVSGDNAPEAMEVKSVSKKDIDREGNLVVDSAKKSEDGKGASKKK